MDFKLNREELTCSVPVIKTEVTQAAEQDFILPDYCPDIFRVLKCCIIPGVTSAGINGGKLTFELSVTIRVIYRTAEGGGVHCVEECRDFSKTVDLPADAVNPSVKIEPAVEYVNCRVVSQRRLDVRGSVICRVCVTGEKKFEAVCGAYGGGVQTKKVSAVFPARRLTSAKRITVIEEMELPAGKPPFGSVVRCDVNVKNGEQKMIPGKLITKGEAEVSLLYLPKDGGGKPPEAMRFSIPFSQIIDIEGLDESFTAEVDMTAPKCVIMPKAEDPAALECELIMLVNISATRYESSEFATDAYSTMYECECEPLEILPPAESEKISAGVELNCTIACSEGEIAQVYDMWCENAAAAVRRDEEKGCSVLYGKAVFCMLGRLSDGSAAYAEKECAFEQDIDISGEVGAVAIKIESSSYTISDEGVQAKAALKAEITSQRGGELRLLKSITLLTDKPKSRDKNCAVKICYADPEGDLWEIAKKYSTSAEAIAEENSAEPADGRRILIIPMKN